jgi:hypothetical protein
MTTRTIGLTLPNVVANFDVLAMAKSGITSNAITDNPKILIIRKINKKHEIFVRNTHSIHKPTRAQCAAPKSSVFTAPLMMLSK